MRISDKTLHNSFLTNLNLTKQRLYEAETQVLTNKRITKPSDDPVDTYNILSMRTKLSDIQQYQRNIGQSRKLLETTEYTVEQLREVYDELISFAIQGASDTYGTRDLNIIAGEVNQYLEHVFNLANTRSDDRYIFAGTSNESAPYQAVRDGNGNIVSVTSRGTDGDIMNVIGEKVSIKTNINGKSLFEDGENLFELAINVRDHILAEDIEALREDLGRLSQASEDIYTIQTTIGGRIKRIDSAEARADNDKIYFEEFMNSIEEIDPTEAIMNYQLELMTLQNSMQAGSRILQSSLIDFLR